MNVTRAIALSDQKVALPTITAAPSPTALVQVSENLYALLLDRPVTSSGDSKDEAVSPSGSLTAVHVVTGEPPSLAGRANGMLIAPFPEAVTPVECKVA
jgi:hypothetical protein